MGVKMGGQKLTGSGATMVAHGAGDTETMHETGEWSPKVVPEGVTPGELEFGAGITIPTQPYASVRIDCRIRLPFIPGDQDAAYQYAVEWVDTRLSVRIDEVKKAYDLK